jgi:hypothetical protein
VRDNTERIRPPRALWVPFELGRPFGAPNEPAFQTKVLRALLALFERTDGPVILEDFDEDAPAAAAADEEGWSCPVSFPQPEDDAPEGLLGQVRAEIEQLAPWYNLAVETRGRTAVGVSGLAITEAAEFLSGFLGGAPESPIPRASRAEALRLVCEDIKAWYFEAATARPGAGADSVTLANWFWGETAAGRLLVAIYPLCADCEDAEVRMLAESQIVPRAQRHRL